MQKRKNNIKSQGKNAILQGSKSNLQQEETGQTDRNNIAEVRHFHFSKQEVQFHNGPLPTAHELAELKKIQPDLVERMMVMSEKEQAHAHKIQSDIVNNQELQHQRELASNDLLHKRNSFTIRLNYFYNVLIILIGVSVVFTLIFWEQYGFATTVFGTIATILAAIKWFGKKA